MAIERVDLDLVEDNPYQPRSSYSTNAIKDLAYSIKEIGMIHTPTARRVNGKFQLAEGHMRLRAYRKLAKQDPKKWGQIPLDIKAIPDTQMALISLEENLRRDDLTPIETARAIENYMTVFPDATETGLAKKINMTQGNISNMRRVLKCPDEILQKIVDGRINFTMGRELLIFKDLNAGPFNQWSGDGNVTKEKDEKWLMLEAVKGIKTSSDRYGEPATVDGIKRSIHSVCESNFRHLEKETTSYGYRSENVPLFNTRDNGCLKCPKMIRAHRVKTEASHFCTDRECWDKLQEEHKQKQRAEAQKKMQEDIAKRLTGTEEDTQQEGGISQEILDPEDMLDEDELEAMYELSGEEDETEEEKKEAELPGFEKTEELCRGCINTKQCSNTRKPLIRNDKGFACASRTTKERFKELREQAKAKMPSAFSNLVKAAAGTRAEVLDTRVLRISSYNDDELQSGYILLSGHSYAPGDSTYGGRNVPTMDLMDDPQECLDRCTNGFHYAFDSSDTEAKVQHVCTRPKCFSGKKAALTRAKNNAGQERKKAEAKAVKQAITGTASLDKARMKLILYAQVAGKHAGKSYYNFTEQESTKVLIKLLGVELKKDDSYGEERTKKFLSQVTKSIDALSEEALAKVVVEFMLSMLTFEGDVKNYKIITTEPLKWLGVNIPNIEKKEK